MSEQGGLSAEKAHTIQVVTEPLPALYGPAPQETWAVALLDDGTEIRMRNLGDRVEIRGWDPKGDCRPPSLRCDLLGRRRHIVDVFAAESAVPPASTPEEGTR